MAPRCDWSKTWLWESSDTASFSSYWKQGQSGEDWQMWGARPHMGAWGIHPETAPDKTSHAIFMAPDSSTQRGFSRGN